MRHSPTCTEDYKTKILIFYQPFSDVKTNKIGCKICAFCGFSEKPEIFQNR